MLERRLILPARMNKEQLRVANRPTRVNAQAAGLLARRSDDVEQHVGHGALVPGSRVESRKDEQLHGVLLPTSMPSLAAAGYTGGRGHPRRRGSFIDETHHESQA